jgi:hypothetical protein
MEATISELPSRIDDILDALNREESVMLTHQGEIKGTIIPSSSSEGKLVHQNGGAISVKDHPLFGSLSSQQQNVNEVMDDLRKSRFDDV